MISKNQVMNRLALCQDENQHQGYAEIANLVCNNSLKGFLGLIPKGFLRKSQRRIKMKNWIGKKWLETKYKHWKFLLFHCIWSDFIRIGNLCFIGGLFIVPFQKIIIFKKNAWPGGVKPKFDSSKFFGTSTPRHNLCLSKSSIFVFIADSISEGRSMVLLAIYHFFNF